MSKKLISQRFLRRNPLKCDRSSTARLRPLPRVLVRWLQPPASWLPPSPQAGLQQNCRRNRWCCPPSGHLTAGDPCLAMRAPGSRVTPWDAVCPAVPSRAAGRSRCSPEDSLRCRKQVQSQDTALDCAMVEIFCSLIHPHVLSLFATVSEERR